MIPNVPNDGGISLQTRLYAQAPSTESLAKRTPFPRDFPLVVAARTARITSIISSSTFRAAKSGSINAAVRLAKEFTTEEFIEKIKPLVSARPIVLSVPSSTNRIPVALADRIAAQFKLEVDDQIYQRSGRHRANASIFRRLWSRKKYAGLIHAGRSYIIVDDVITQGGTLADLRGYVESGNGKVVCAVVLAAAAGARRLRISDSTLQRLHNRVGMLEGIWKENFGFGFEALTNSEGRALAYFAFSLSKGYNGAPRKARIY